MTCSEHNDNNAVMPVPRQQQQFYVMFTDFLFMLRYSSRDALLVKCKMTTGETCIVPKPNLIHMNGLDREGDGHMWFSDMSSGHTVSQTNTL